MSLSGLIVSWWRLWLLYDCICFDNCTALETTSSGPVAEDLYNITLIGCSPIETASTAEQKKKNMIGWQMLPTEFKKIQYIPWQIATYVQHNRIVPMPIRLALRVAFQIYK